MSKRVKSKLTGYPNEEVMKDLTDHAVKKYAAKLQRNQAVTNAGIPDIDIQNTAARDEIRQYLNESLYWYGAKLVKSNEEVAERLNKFFLRIQETGEIPNVEKLALCLGTTSSNIREWRIGKNCDAERMGMVKQAVEMIASMEASLVQHRKIPEVTYIFRAKNYYDLRDQQDIVIKPDNPFSETTIDEMREKYLSQVGSVKGDIEVK